MSPFYPSSQSLREAAHASSSTKRLRFITSIQLQLTDF
jgi:hypothetical protein